MTPRITNSDLNIGIIICQKKIEGVPEEEGERQGEN